MPACDIILGERGVVGQVEGESSVVARHHVPGSSTEEELAVYLGRLSIVQQPGARPRRQRRVVYAGAC